jgi:hypothetical protein
LRISGSAGASPSRPKNDFADLLGGTYDKLTTYGRIEYFMVGLFGETNFKKDLYDDSS